MEKMCSSKLVAFNGFYIIIDVYKFGYHDKM